MRVLGLLCVLGVVLMGYPQTVAAQTTRDSTQRDTTVVRDTVVRDTLSAVYAYIQGTDTIAYEAIRLQDSLIQGAFVTPNVSRIMWEHAITDGLPAGLTLGVFPPDAGPWTAALQEVEYHARGDSMVTIAFVNGKTSTDVLPARAGAIPMLGRSMLHAAYVAFFAQRAKQLVVPLFMTVGSRVFDGTISVQGERLTLTVNGLVIHSDWVETQPVEITVPSQGLRIVRMATVSAPIGPAH